MARLFWLARWLKMGQNATTMVHLFLRSIAAVAGMLMLYSGFFMFEDAEGKLQNRLEEIWIKIHDRENKIGHQPAAIFNRVAGFVSKQFDILFGQQLISFQAFGSSMLYSCAAVVVFIIFGMPLAIAGEANVHSWHLVVPILISLSISFGFLKLVQKVPRSTSLGITFAVGIGVLITGLFALTVIWNGSELGVLYMAGAFVCSFLSDIVLIALVRQMARVVCKTTSIWAIIVALAIQVAVTAIMIGAPLMTAMKSASDNSQLAAGFLIVLNVPTGLVSLALLASLLVVVAHRIFWPVLSHLIYPIARFSLLRNRGFMGSAGTACLAFAFPWLHWLLNVKDWLK